MQTVLSANPDVVVLASEEDDAAIPCPGGATTSSSSSSSSDAGYGYAVVFDPLDGSRNIDAAIPTGELVCGGLRRGFSRDSLTQQGAALIASLDLIAAHS